ncbi:hypothetical protein ACULPM_06475 [Thermophilibacter sp. ZX-H3]|uniref:hypothetical protein n=1 Tax=unclassified Thermophilibacter TaxID=2847308 RepID=UPI0040407B42
MERVVALAEPAERLVRKKTSEFMAQDRRELLALGSELDLASQTLSEDGAVLASPSSAAAAWARAAGAVESFLTSPRRARRFDLEDFFMSVDGIYDLAACVELLRRLLLAAGRSLNALGAATLGHHDFSGVGDAVALWEVSEGSAARRLASALARLMSRTPGLSGGGAKDALLPDSRDAYWIESCSQLGQDVLRWVYGRGKASLNFAGIVGVAWPGPAIYGYDDGEEEPEMACELCAALESGRRPEHPLLLGTHEATISQDLVVPIPEDLLEGARHLFITQGAEEPGALFCQTPSRHFARLAQLISSEQELVGYPWDFIESGVSAAPGNVPENLASSFEEEFALCASGEEVPVKGGGLPLRETVVCDWAKPGAPVVILGLGDRFVVASAERRATYERWSDADSSGLPQARFQE